jgi:hypothetical protein
VTSRYSYMTPSHAIQGRNAHRPLWATEGSPDPAIDNEVRWLNRVSETAGTSPAPLPAVSRDADPGIQAETRGLNWVFDRGSEPIPSRGLGATDVTDPDTGKVVGRAPNVGSRLLAALTDFQCWKGHGVIGGAISSIWITPAGGAAAAAATLAAQQAICPRLQGGAGLARQLGIRRADADRLLKDHAYTLDASTGRYVANTTFNQWKLALQPYVPYIAIGGLILAAVIATGD